MSFLVSPPAAVMRATHTLPLVEIQPVNTVPSCEIARGSPKYDHAPAPSSLSATAVHPALPWRELPPVPGAGAQEELGARPRFGIGHLRRRRRPREVAEHEQLHVVEAARERVHALVVRREHRE